MNNNYNTREGLNKFFHVKDGIMDFTLMADAGDKKNKKKNIIEELVSSVSSDDTFFIPPFRVDGDNRQMQRGLTLRDLKVHNVQDLIVYHISVFKEFSSKC